MSGNSRLNSGSLVSASIATTGPCETAIVPAAIIPTTNTQASLAASAVKAAPSASVVGVAVLVCAARCSVNAINKTRCGSSGGIRCSSTSS